MELIERDHEHVSPTLCQYPQCASQHPTILPSPSGLQRVTGLQLESQTEQELALDVLWDRRAGTQCFSCCLGLTDQASLSLPSKAGHADPSQGSGNRWLHGRVGFPYREDL